MFWLALLWIALAGTGVHLLQDTTFRKPPSDTLTLEDVQGRFDRLALNCEFGLLFLWPLFLVEGLLHRSSGAGQLRQHIWFSLFPFLRLVGRDHVDGRTLWLPFLGWVEANDDLKSTLEKHFSVPMIAAALLVLPVLAIEFFWQSAIQKYPALGMATHLAGALIWLAFAVEFIVMVSIVRRRWLYVRLHWLDLAIICLPLLAFLRVMRVGRVGRLLRIQQLMRVTEASKAFRLRGLAFRLWRAVLVFEVVDRVLQRDIEHKLAVLRNQLAERETEAGKLRDQITELEAILRETQEKLAEEERLTVEAALADSVADGASLEAAGSEGSTAGPESIVAGESR